MPVSINQALIEKYNEPLAFADDPLLVYLIDASVYVFRAWYARGMDTRDAEGNPTNALYGFARMLGDLVERKRPGYIAVAFDESFGSNHRHALLPSYKANRDPAPPDLVLQFERSHLPAGYGAPFEVRQLELNDQSRMAPLESRESAGRAR